MAARSCTSRSRGLGASGAWRSERTAGRSRLAFDASDDASRPEVRRGRLRAWVVPAGARCWACPRIRRPSSGAWSSAPTAPGSPPSAWRWMLRGRPQGAPSRSSMRRAAKVSGTSSWTSQGCPPNWCTAPMGPGSRSAVSSAGPWSRSGTPRRVRLRFELRGHPDEVRSLAFGPDGRRLIEADSLGIQEWDVSADREVRGCLTGGWAPEASTWRSAATACPRRCRRRGRPGPGSDGVRCRDRSRARPISEGVPLSSRWLLSSPSARPLAAGGMGGVEGPSLGVPKVQEHRPTHHSPWAGGDRIRGDQVIVGSIVAGGPADHDGRIHVGNALIGLEREDGTRIEFAGRTRGRSSG